MVTSDLRTTETDSIPSPAHTDSKTLDASGAASGLVLSTLDSSANVERDGDDFIIDASLVGELLDVQPSEVPALMQSNRITSVCEIGVDGDRGTFRLNLFYLGRHARLRVDAAGHVLHRSVIDFGEAALLQRRRKHHSPSNR